MAPVFLLGALVLQIRGSIDFAATRLGIVVATYYLAAALASVPLAKVPESIGPWRAIRLGCFLMGILLTMLTAAQSFHVVLILGAVMGAVSGGIQPATNLLLVRQIPAARIGLAFGIKQAAVPFGMVIGGASVPALALTLGWRWAFATAAAVALGTGLVMPSDTKALVHPIYGRAKAQFGAGDRVGLILLVSGFGLGVASASALVTFSVTAAAATGFGPAEAGVLASVGAGATVVTRVCLGLQADRRRQAPLVLVSAFLGVASLAYAVLAFSTSRGSIVVWPAMVLAYSAGWGWNGLLNLAIATRYPARAASATAFAAIGSRSGGVLGPLAFGFAVAHSSYGLAWMLLAVAALGAAGIVFIAQLVLVRAN